MTDIHRLPIDREEMFWDHQRTRRAQMVNDYIEDGPDLISPSYGILGWRKWLKWLAPKTLAGRLWLTGVRND